MTYGIVAIVKNETDNMGTIARWLDYAPADRWTICDTGSTDGMGSLIEGLGVTVHHDEWLNFGHNRSLAFGRARGTADWLLALDADMTLEIDPDFEPNPLVDAYMIQMGSPGFSYRLPLLLRGDLPWESRGAVHEYTCLPDLDYTNLPTDQVRVTYPHDRSSREKSLWHASLLEGHEDSRSIFYLAQTYADLGDSRALALYDQRIKMGGWDEEVFYSMYRRATMLPGWAARMLAFIEAWEFRPSRLEPAYELAKGLNYGGKHQAAYRFASTPIEPTSDILFVHAWVWDWGLKFERSIAAWWLGLWDEFDALTGELLDNPRVPAHVMAQVIINSEIERRVA